MPSKICHVCGRAIVVMMNGVPPEIQDLVETPRELLHMELKEWIDLKDELNRAKTARHLAALCNHGGGYLLFGFRDDGSPSAAHPSDVSIFNRDTIGGIIDRYLAPAFQCEVFHATRRGTFERYPVVRVPGHGSVPICAKRNGPHDARNNPQGIRQGFYYIRVPGPKSAAIETPEQWRELIHRCVVHEGESLIASISKIIRAPEQKKKNDRGSLLDWHRKVHNYYLVLLESVRAEWPVSVRENHYQFSYRIVGEPGVPLLPGGALLEAIRQAGEQVRNVVWTGWSMFHPFTREEIKPRFVTDTSRGEEIEALETILVGETFIAETVPDFWRITADGRATIIRPYREDRVPLPHLQKRGMHPGTWLSPQTLAREVYEVVTHAKELAKCFEAATGVEFRCTWYGLKDRRIADFDPSIDWQERKSRVNERSISACASLAALAGNPQSIVEEMVAPVGRLFDGLEITASAIESWRPGFRKL
jgi:hypothetical protein